MAILIDTSFLLAVVLSQDKYHARAIAAVQKIKQVDGIIASPVIPEVFQIIAVRVSHREAIKALNFIRNGRFQLEDVNRTDMGRIAGILSEYSSAEFDYADAAIMAIAERLNIQRIYTFDRRDFSLFKPIHCDYLELLP